MHPILCYGVPSGCSFGSIVALEWLGQPYRLCRIDMPNEVTGDAYRRINPIGETPSLLDGDGQVISESLAILNHLGARGIDRGLGFAQGTRDFDRLNQLLAYLNTSFFGDYETYFVMTGSVAGMTPGFGTLSLSSIAGGSNYKVQMQLIPAPGSPGASVTITNLQQFTS